MHELKHIIMQLMVQLPAARRQSDASQQAAAAAAASPAPPAAAGLPPAAPSTAAAGLAGPPGGPSDQACLDHAAQHFSDFDRAQAVADMAGFKGRQHVLYKVRHGGGWCCHCALGLHVGCMCGMMAVLPV
jgi:hypothetical protein